MKPVQNDARKQRGIELAAMVKITRRADGGWTVPSQAGKGRYTVFVTAQKCTCNCPDHEFRGKRCKHIYAVEYAERREQNPDGSVTVERAVRVTYPQNWPAYNAAQTNEKSEFQSLLFDLCSGITDPPQAKGRPRLPLRDAVFAATFKVYSTFSGRRFISDLCDAQAKGYLSRVPHFNSIFNYLENPALEPILTDLVIAAGAPLSSIESDFAIDSTGFATSRFIRWFDHKYGTVRQEHDWCKAHFVCGVKTNVVTAIEIHERNSNDTPQLPSLLDTTAKNFNVAELSGDSAYASVGNFNAIARHNVTPYIAFKSRHNGKSGGLFRKAYHYFCLNRDEFFGHYHKRSNIESTVMMVKTKFGDGLRSKTDAAMRNEVLCKFLCHNVCCLISATHELGIEPLFNCTKSLAPAQNLR
jgi:transposase